jgi:hypothetical protein
VDLDVHDSSKKKGKQMNQIDVKFFLRENFRKESERYFGLKDAKWIDRATDNWFDDQNNYDGRWKIFSVCP